MFLESLSAPTVAVAGAAVLLSVVLWSRRKPSNLPPGPPHVPFLGTVMSMQDFTYPHKQFLEWAKTYGPIFTFSMGNHHLVVLNSFAVIKDALVTHSRALSGRPPLEDRDAAFNPHPNIRYGVIDSPPDAEWKNQRNTSLQILRSLGLGRNSLEVRIQEEAAYLCDLLRRPDPQPMDPTTDINVSIANIICAMLFGTRYEHTDTEFVRLLDIIERTFHGYAEMPGADYYPVMKLSPQYRTVLANLKKNAGELHGFLGDRIAERRERLEKDGYDDPQNFIEHYLVEMEKAADGKSRLGENRLPLVLSDFFLAGAETTATTLGWAMLLMAQNRGVQGRVHAALDAAAGGGAPHTFSLADRKHLPYIDATLMEVQRLANIVPVSLDHETTEDVTLQGYHLPAGTHVLVNLTSALHDPEVWPEPEVLRPERFLSSEGEIEKKEEWIPFSMGRRMCLGEQLAKQELFLFFTHLLHRFDVSLPEGAPDYDMAGVPKLVLKPPKYQVILTPRF